MFAGTGLSAGKKKGKLYVDDVFSTYLYTGNGSTQTITNGIDLAGEGGLVWIKLRSGPNAVSNHALFDTERGAGNRLASNTTDANFAGGNVLTGFTSSGFTLDASVYNDASNSPASWTFRKAPKFFDVVTYTGNGTTQNITHSLGIEPGMIVIKNLSVTDNWYVWHRSFNGGVDQYQYRMFLNLTNAMTGVNSTFLTSNPTTTQFSVGSSLTTNDAGRTYVAYLFAHDTATDGMIQCGSFTDVWTLQTVTLGWEPQFILYKNITRASAWMVFDAQRGMTVDAGGNGLQANISNAEWFINTSLAGVPSPKPVGFNFADQGNASNYDTYIYLAIRRPNKPPTSGTQVYNAIARTGTGAAATVTGVGFAPDLQVFAERGATQSGAKRWHDRLRGVTLSIASQSTAAESATYADSLTAFLMDGFAIGADSNYQINYSGATYINHFFRRAPGFFDVVCYTGVSSGNQNINHSLGAVPELIITKCRSNIVAWYSYSVSIGLDAFLLLNSTGASTTASGMWPSAPTATTFSINVDNIGMASRTGIAYLFATLAGISKVFSYTGNGTSQTINCGFSAGARFVLIKRTDSTGDWYVWDTARGIVAANDPHLSLNTTAAEVTTDDSIDPDTSGFIVNQVAATNINVNGATYIGLAIA